MCRMLSDWQHIFPALCCRQDTVANIPNAGAALVTSAAAVTAGAAGTSSSSSNTGTGATAAYTELPAASGGSGSRAQEGAQAQPSGEDKENDAAAVTAVIWKELAELSAAQAKLKVCTHLVLFHLCGGI